MLAVFDRCDTPRSRSTACAHSVARHRRVIVRMQVRWRFERSQQRAQRWPLHMVSPFHQVLVEEFVTPVVLSGTPALLRRVHQPPESPMEPLAEGVSSGLRAQQAAASLKQMRRLRLPSQCTRAIACACGRPSSRSPLNSPRSAALVLQRRRRRHPHRADRFACSTSAAHCRRACVHTFARSRLDARKSSHVYARIAAAHVACGCLHTCLRTCPCMCPHTCPCTCLCAC